MLSIGSILYITDFAHNGQISLVPTCPLYTRFIVKANSSGDAVGKESALQLVDLDETFLISDMKDFTKWYFRHPCTARKNMEEKNTASWL